MFHNVYSTHINNSKGALRDWPVLWGPEAWAPPRSSQSGGYSRSGAGGQLRCPQDLCHGAGLCLRLGSLRGFLSPSPHPTSTSPVLLVLIPMQNPRPSPTVTHTQLLTLNFCDFGKITGPLGGHEVGHTVQHTEHQPPHNKPAPFASLSLSFSKGAATPTAGAEQPCPSGSGGTPSKPADLSGIPAKHT